MSAALVVLPASGVRAQESAGQLPGASKHVEQALNATQIIQTKSVLRSAHPANPFTPRGPGGCPITSVQLAPLPSTSCPQGINFDNLVQGMSVTVQQGFSQTEWAVISAQIPLSAFPIKIEQVDVLIGGSTTVQTTTRYGLGIWDGTPNTSGTLFYEVSNNDGIPPDDAVLPAGNVLDDIQVSIDNSADIADQWIISNPAGGGVISVGFTIIHHNNALGDGCLGSFDLPNNSNVFPCTFRNDACSIQDAAHDWLYGIDCSYYGISGLGCPPHGGWSTFTNLSTSCRPTRDWLIRFKWSSVNCVVLTGACCAPSGSCTVIAQASCTGTSTYLGDNSVCGTGSCPTGACCASGGGCSTTTSAGCTSGAYQGAGTSSCTPNICPQPTGACCTLGSCTLSASAGCISGGGTYQGNNVICANVSCPQPTAACCFGNGCLTANAADCANAGGAFQGNSSACTAASACPTGACCITSTGSCSTTTPAACTASGSVYTNAAACSTTLCPLPTGACCTTTGGCLPGQTQTACTNISGFTWRGAGTTCSPNPCATTGVCCRGATCATGFTQANCTSPGGTIGAAFVSGSACNSGSSTSPCCIADFNKSGTRNVNDIFDFLSAWFATSPYAHTGGNGAGTPVVSDIFSFLSAWFGPGC